MSIITLFSTVLSHFTFLPTGYKCSNFPHILTKTCYFHFLLVATPVGVMYPSCRWLKKNTFDEKAILSWLNFSKFHLLEEISLVFVINFLKKFLQSWSLSIRYLSFLQWNTRIWFFPYYRHTCTHTHTHIVPLPFFWLSLCLQFCSQQLKVYIVYYFLYSNR